MTTTGTDIVELDRIAVHEALRVVELAHAEDWERDTPARAGTCGGSWRTWPHSITGSRPPHVARAGTWTPGGSPRT